MSLLIYGVTGYTGALISRLAAEQGLAHIAAGRDQARVAEHARPLGLATRSFGLDNVAALDAALADVTVILNCAGPFARTAPALVAACLRTGTHYLDLAGEAPEFERLVTQGSAAQAAGVMLLPGAGFGVVPTDCMALYLKQQLPDATRLTLAFETTGGASQGTLGTVISDLPHAGAVRQAGRLVPAQPAAKRRRIDLGHGPRPAVLNPWRGDIVTALHSTGIQEIETFSVFPAPLRWAMGSPLIRRWLGKPSNQQRLKRLIQRLPAGPDAAALAQGKTAVWGEVSNAAGETRSAWLHGPEAYLFTARTAVAIAQQVLAGHAPAGFQTPASAYGADFVLSIRGVTRSV